MFAFSYKGYSIHGYFDKDEVKVFPPEYPHGDAFYAKSVHAAKIKISKEIKEK